MDQDAVFLATRHSCLWCSANGRSASTQKQTLRFCASAAGAIELLPGYVKTAWTLHCDNTGRLCDEMVVDLIRALATCSTWTKIAAVLNELRATRAARLNVQYLALCATLGMEPSLHAGGAGATRVLDRKWVAQVYERDTAARSRDIASELLAEMPADILAIDWTHDAGVRCQGTWMFNATDADGKVLASVATKTTAPLEVEPVLRDLHSRGARPTIIYVDCECCGAWKPIIEKVWPGANIVLDSFHAMRRLTQTTSSTRHPWHAEFCKRVSEAMFAEDEVLSARFNKAFKRSKLRRKARARLKAECVTRRINDKSAIEKSIDDAIAEYKTRIHPTFGPLLTPKTLSAWSSLKLHVRNGCLRDPPGVDLYTVQAKPLVVGGETLDKFKSKRGSSALEGFHSIQKSWLGQQVHSRKRGLALVADGTVRHNRRRRNHMASDLQQTPPVYAAGLLSPTDHCYRTFIEDCLRRLLSQSVARVRPPVRDTEDERFYHVQSLLPSNGSCHQPTAETRVENEQALVAQETGHGQSDGMIEEMVGPGESNDLHMPSADTKREANKASSSTGAAPAPATLRVKQHRANTDKVKQQHQEQDHQQPLPATSIRSGCRTCRMTGTKCKLYKRIQWCASFDPPFEDWIKNEFPVKKAAALERAQCKAARRGKPKGRPTKRRES